MVSPVPNAAKSPPLSYADRVKKSQRNGAANASPAQRPLSQSVTSPVASPRTNGPQGTVFSPSATVSSKSSSEVSKSPQRQPIAPPQAEKPTTPRQTNGEAHSADVEPVAGPSSSTSKKVPAPPGANVWDLRKVHLAAKVAPQSLPQQPAEAYQGLPASKGPTASAPPADTAPPAPSQKNVSVTPATKPAAVQERPLARATEEDEDAWVVRPDRAPAAVRLNRLDASSWPEVGKAPVNGVGDAGDAAKEDKGKKDSQGPASRKSEKTKWVPIPAQELQAAVDANRPSRSSTASHSRSQSQQRPQSRTQGSSNTTTGAARANRASTERSKRDRTLGSTSHSEAHSRTGSIHSSPRHASSKPRRLPDDGAGPSSLRSSRAGSPRPQLPPTASAVESTYTMHPHAAPFYPAHIPVPSPYPPPYPPAFNPAAAPYAMYAPYPPAPTYAYWSNPVPGQDRRNPYVVSSQSQSPTTHNSSVVNGDRSDITSPSTSIDPSPAGTTEPIAAKPDNASVESSRGRPRVLSFGSITPNAEALPEASNAVAAIDAADSLGLSVADLDLTDVPEKTPRNEEQDTSLETDTLTPSFNVGLAPGDPGPSKRRTQSNQVPSTSTSRTRTTSAPEASSTVEHDSEQDAVKPSTSEPTWVFGTTKQGADEADTGAKPASQGLVAPETARPEGVASAIPPRLRLSPLGSVVNPEGLPPTPVPVSTSGLYAGNSPITLNDAADGDEWKVRDFGYGHGRGKDGIPSTLRDDRGGRPYYGGRSVPRIYEGGGDGYRRGYGGRRGRGSSRGYGRGGRPIRGEFGGGRGGYGGRWHPREGDFEGDEAYAYGMPGPVDTTVYYGAPPMLPGGYYAPPGYDFYAPYPAPYAPPPIMPPVASPTSAPTPAPITKLSFPLDQLRYYLLGQLEFYLSEDNLIRDIYLRQHMDSQGWVPTSLLASFPRVQALTAPTGLPTEYQMEIVKDVLVLSSLVEVRGDWVRIHQWERFKLPDAAPSVVDVEVGAPEYVAPPTFNAEEYLAVNASAAAAQAAEVVEVRQDEIVVEAPVVDAEPAGDHEEEEEDDEDDVEIVLGKDADRSWTPERKANVS